MRLVLKMCLLFVLCSTFVLGQRNRGLSYFDVPIIDKELPASVAKAYKPTTRPSEIATPANFTIIDSMVNIFSYLLEEIHPLYYSPALNVLTHVHRADLSYAPSSGSLFYAVSTDGGLTWTRCGHFNRGQAAGEQLARYPSGSIYFNSNLGEYYQIAAYPQLSPDPVEWRDMGYGADFPFASCLPFAATVIGEDRVYSPGAPTWSTDQMAFWAINFTFAGEVIPEIWRTPDFAAPVGSTPTALDTFHLAGGGWSMFGGDAIKVGPTTITAFAVPGASYLEYDSVFTTHTINVIYSMNHGVTWSMADTINFASVPGLGEYRSLWHWAAGNQTPGSMVLDSLGEPHIFCGMQKEPQFTAGADVVLAELYKEGGQWKGRIVAAANPSTVRGVGQVGYMPFIARNEEGTFFAAQWLDSKEANNEPDIWVSGRYWRARSWTAPKNITATPTRGEYLAHFSPRMRRDGDSLFTVFTSICIPSDTTDWDASPNLTYIYSGRYQLNLTPINTDAAALKIDAPDVGYAVTAESSFTLFRATFKNTGELAHTSPLVVRYKVFNPAGVEVYSNTQNIPPLGQDESVTITFPGSVNAPLAIGVWRLEASVSLPGDQAPGNDVAVGYVRVIVPSSICYTTVTKRYAPYVPLVDGTVITPIGAYPYDDGHHLMELPFPFSYDGETYDSIRFYVNGQIELGKRGHARNTTYGLSTPNTIGWNENGRLFREGIPTKIFSAWWEDLNLNLAGDPEASLSYKVEGTAPNRVLIIQWNSLLAYYDSTQTDARVSFQTRLYEKTNIIEFHYGPVQPGTWAGADVGAMIGLKNHVGGDYQFFDVNLNGGGQRRNGVILYSTNIEDVWPGPDTVFIIQMQKTVSVVTLDARWNLISVPVVRTNNDVLNIYPTALSNTTYRFVPGTGYLLENTLVPGRGYWTKFPDVWTQLVAGGPLPSIDVPVQAGWNLVGSVDHDIPAPSGGNIVSQFFGFRGGYVPVTILKPGKGYWVKVAATGNLTLGSAISAKESPVNIEAVSSITIADRLGRQQTLYITADAEGKIPLAQYEMPPVPPMGEFDARFASQRILETYRPDDIDGAEFPIVMQSPEYPLTISSSVKENGYMLVLEEVQNEKVVATHYLKNGGSVKIASGAANSLVVKVVQGQLIPKEFALGQNYPNPFNPTTRFMVELPKDAFVQVVVYDILGRRVATLMNGSYEAGYHPIEWNSTNDAGLTVPSGIYFIRMASEQFTAVRKVMLLK